MKFQPFYQLQRPGLLLSQGVVYLGFGSHADAAPFHGWILGYTFDGANFTQKYVFCTTPNGGDGGIWMAGKGLTADASGNIWFTDSLDNAVYEFVGAGAPRAMPLQRAVINGSLGTRP